MSIEIRPDKTGGVPIIGQPKPPPPPFAIMPLALANRRNLTTGAKLVMVLLAWVDQYEPDCHNVEERIGEMSGQSKSRVRGQITELLRTGTLRKKSDLEVPV